MRGEEGNQHLSIACRRLVAQHLTHRIHSSIADVVHHMTAMQAQDAAMVRWAVGIRLPGTTDAAVRQALDRGEIIRTHLLRPTWHLVAAADLRWLLALTAPHIRRRTATRHRDLEITPAVEAKSLRIIADVIGSRGPLTREDLGEALQRSRIVLSDNRLSHLLMLAELHALICSGPFRGKQATYALVDDRVPRCGSIGRAEACAALVRRYLAGHGPASVRDVVWWSGLSASDVQHAIEDLGGAVHAESIDGETYWSTDEHAIRLRRTAVHLLPAFDEFIIAYADRSASLPAPIAKGVVSSNGIFRAAISVDGSVVGLWTRESAKAGVHITMNILAGMKRPAKTALDAAAAAYASFAENKPLLHG